jgi:hypothetical protein
MSSSKSMLSFNGCFLLHRIAGPLFSSNREANKDQPPTMEGSNPRIFLLSTQFTVQEYYEVWRRHAVLLAVRLLLREMKKYYNI